MVVEFCDRTRLGGASAIAFGEFIDEEILAV
jgi:hypothetical protein